MNTTYWLAFAFGFTLVLLVSLEVFNEPSYKKTERGLYKKFRPRDVTSNKLYFRSLILYLASMEFLYTAISSSTELGLALKNSKISSNLAHDPTYPLLAATIVVGFQSAWYIKEIEKRLRAWLHKWAKIPEGARRTIDDLRRSRFVFDRYMEPSILGNRDNLEFESIRELNLSPFESELEKKWTKICCILYSLRISRENSVCPTGGVDSTCYDDHFFDEYLEEYKEIKSLHRGLANSITRYWEQVKSSGQGSTELERTRETIMEDLNFLQERLYAFIACAVRSRQPSESEVATALNKFGFRLSKEGAPPVDLLAVINAVGFSAVLVLIGVNIADWYFQSFGSSLLQNSRYVPQSEFDKILWPLATFLYHGVAVSIALFYRKRKVGQNKWESWEGNSPSRPYLRYIWAALFGGLGGYFVLVILSLIDFGVRALLGQELSLLHELPLIFLDNLIWISLGGISAWCAVYYRDTPVEELTKGRRVLMPLLQGLVMGLLGYISTRVYTELWHFFSGVPDPTIYARLDGAYAIFVGTMLFLIGGFMGYYFPKRRIWLSNKIFQWVGSWEVSQEEGEIFSMTLKPDKTAITDIPGRGRGHWAVAGDRVRIRWQNAWIDYISKEADHYMKYGYQSEASVELPPNQTAIVQKMVH